ncbi:DUF2917 domain-containing protein [Corallococcus macrosporus]|uniref:DUF2917 domain-containing protein n=1 Tax=Corallococcus macrosporus DSM 14697 TaxID=1189310 RepID=A0A250K619_9BACT|nr:DUF2917 domain-containing protein [Corallococcus macrosporus]ATB51122.1 hypothetical protein MYMAC_006779 [Corallococcus macrosporus DSM 14697]
MWDWMRTVVNGLRFEAAPARSVGPVHLAQGGLWSQHTRSGHPLTLTCRAGLLWLTCEGDERDYVLHPGDTLRLKRPGHVVVQALRPSRFCLMERAPAPSPCTPPPPGHGAPVR